MIGVALTSNPTNSKYKEKKSFLRKWKSYFLIHPRQCGIEEPLNLKQMKKGLCQAKKKTEPFNLKIRSWFLPFA
jgi:hypothetical protein